MTSVVNILNFVPVTFTNAKMDSIFFLITTLLYIFGLWGIFSKCGVPGWQAVIPCLREIRLGEVSGMEKEGRIAASIQGTMIVIGIICAIVPQLLNEDFSLLVTGMRLVLALFLFIYMVRIELSLCEVFGRSKWWIVLWVAASFIPAVIWGWLKPYQPKWKVSELKKMAENYFSNAKAAVLGEGLTVNLEERTVSEFFKKKYLLRDIHMYIRPGHMVLLLGGSGAGKTTFLNAVNGYEPANAEIMLSGRNMYREYKDMMYDIGFVPQQDLMRSTDTVYNTMMDAATLRLPENLSPEMMAKRVDEVMDIFGLTPVKDNMVVKLSGGQRKRLSIAMEFLSNPTLFILDEPDSGLDGVMARKLFEKLREIADQGKIIIVITHTPDRVIDLFDDVIVLAKDSNRTGRLAYFGPIQEAREFFGKEKMEEIVMSVNREEEGGEGRADEFVNKYAQTYAKTQEVQHV